MKGKRMLATLLAAMIACGSVATTASVVSAAETTAMVAAQAVSASNVLPTDVTTPVSYTHLPRKSYPIAGGKSSAMRT